MQNEIMSARLLETGSINAFTAILDGAILDSDTTIQLSTTTGLVAPGVICVDRVDGANVATPIKREYISFDGIAGNNLTDCQRGLGGSIAQAHDSGARVEENFSTTHWGDLLDFLRVSHNESGNIVASSATLTNATILGNLNLSGASIVGNFPLNPVWIVDATGSTPTLVGEPLSMPQNGYFSWLSATLTTPAASGATTAIDLRKNGSSMGAKLYILGGGTYASTASFSSPAFSRGQFIQPNIDAIGSSDLRITIQGRG